MATVLTGQPATAAQPVITGKYQPMPPQRVLDTRVGIGASMGQPEAGSTLDLQVAGTHGVPHEGVTAVTLNVTVTGTRHAGYVQVMPTGSEEPGASSNVNVTGFGQTASNLVTVPVGTGGKVSLYNVAGAHLIADVQGYFTVASESAEGRYQPVTPTRVLDSRDRTGMPAVPPPPAEPTPTPPTPPAPPAPPAKPADKDCRDFTTWAEANAWFHFYLPWYGDFANLDGTDGDGIPCESLPGAPGAAGQLAITAASSTERSAVAAFDPYPKPAPGEVIDLRMNGLGGLPASGVSAVALTVTATDSSAAGFVQVVPAAGSTALGTTSNINLTGAGQTVANLVFVPLGAGGSVQLYNSSGTDLIVDVVGYFTDPSAAVSTAGLFVPVTPARLSDTRQATIAEAGSRTDHAPAGRAGIPNAGVAAVFLNATATGTGGPGYLQIFPTGRGTPGASSSVNFTAAEQTVATAAIGGLGDRGQVSVFTPTRTHVVLDVFGYFTDATRPLVAGDSLLAGLVVAAKASPVPYDRDTWVHWIDEDQDCQDTRDEVLIVESLTTPMLDAAGCNVVSGTWEDPYTGLLWTVPSDLDIDHVVALKNANDSGGWAWDASTKRRFANDLVRAAHLIAVEDNLNQAKSDSGPDTWRPPATGYWCEYATDWANIKADWGLTVTQEELDALEAMLASC